MLGVMLLCLIFAASNQEDDAVLRRQHDQLSTQLLVLQGSVQEKELYILKQDEMISDLQNQLQGVKAAELEAMLKRNEQELFKLQEKTKSLLADIDRLGSESEQLEIISAIQKKQLNEAQLALHDVEELILQAHIQVDEKNQDIRKGTWTTTFNDVWKRVALAAVRGYEKLHKSKFLKHLDVLEMQIATYTQRAQKVVEEAVLRAWKLCKSVVGEPVQALGSRLSFLQPYLLKLSQHFRKALKYGIKHHLQLQRKVRRLLLRNAYLASKESKEVVWFLASALLILPLYGALLLSSFLSKRMRSPASSSNSRRSREARPLRHAHR